MRIKISSSLAFREGIAWITGIFLKNKQIPYRFVREEESADLLIGDEPDAAIYLHPEFWNALEKSGGIMPSPFEKECLIRDKEGRIDYLATAFYMINSLQEYGSTDLDEIGRFKYENSYQSRFGNVQENLVQSCFNLLLANTPQLRDQGIKSVPTRFFLSHDIDSVNGALLQDGLFVLKKGRIDVMFSLLFHAVMQKPDWLNMDKIMQVENEHSFKSTFYWLVNKGRVNGRMVNADYDIGAPAIRRMHHQIPEYGWENGLHKSVSPEDFRSELDKLNLNVNANRYHYLKFNLPQAYGEIERSGLKSDASLGFAEAYGFRNSYGQPFRPFDMQEKKIHNFVEIPLHLMDGTFQRYMQLPVKETANKVIDFIEKNRNDCVLSLLWHNTFFTNYKYAGYLEEYKKILAYLHENTFECRTSQQILFDYLN